MDCIESRGISIPRLGFGTFRMPGGDCRAVVESALELGYRHLDTAKMYDNEEQWVRPSHPPASHEAICS